MFSLGMSSFDSDASGGNSARVAVPLPVHTSPLAKMLRTSTS
jgi:hypothetical protein